MGRVGRQRMLLGSSSVGSRGVRWVGAVAFLGSLCLSTGLAVAQDEAPAEEAAAQEPAAPPTETQTRIDQAKKQIEGLDYPAAQEALLNVVKLGKATPTELSDAYFSLGIVEAALGNDVESTDSFYLALMITPSLLFPEGGSPKIRERLNEARSRVTEVGVLQVRAAVRSGVLDVHLDNDPLNLVRRVDVTMTREGGESGKVTLEKSKGGLMRAEVESGVKTIQVGVYDESGNQLKVLDVDPATGGLSGSEIVGPPPSVWESWGLWAGVAGALAIGGTYFIMEAGSLDDDIQKANDATPRNPAEFERLQDNQDRVALYGVIGLSLAGAAAVTSGALLLFGGDDKPAAEGEASLVPNIAPGNYGARFTLKF